MWRDFHIIDGAAAPIVFFPVSGKLYSVPEKIAGMLRAYLAERGPLPREAEAMLQTERARAEAPIASPEPSAVSSLCLYAAHDCNLACTYCYNQRGRAVKPLAMMAPQTAVAAMDRFFVQPGESYAAAFYGGEPLLNLSVIEAAVEHAKQLRSKKGVQVSFSLTTNGTIMNREILALLGGHFSSVTVSLDGAAEVNDLHRRYASPRGRSIHGRAVETIRLLKAQTALRVTVKGTLTAQGLPHYRESLAHLRGLGADAASLDPVFGPEDADWALDREGLAQYVQLAVSGRELFESDDSAQPWSEQGFQVAAGLLTRRRLLRHCNAGCDLAVMADGSLYACHGLAGAREFYMGSASEPESPEFARVHREFAALEVRTIEGCDTCWARFLCGGSCYANAYFRTGTLRRPDPNHCLVFKQIAERILVQFAAAASQPAQAQVMARRLKEMIAAVVPSPHV